MNEVPSIASAFYASNTFNPAEMGFAAQQAVQRHSQQVQRLGERRQDWGAAFEAAQKQAEGRKPMAVVSRRLVQVFIADPHESVPLDMCLLYSGEQKLTDLTDEELFFEINIKSVLDEHNAKRTKLVNKAIKERTEHLEAARIRDLKMTIVTIASF